MKKKSFFSVIAAVIAAASMAVTAGAADYSSDPSYLLPPSRPSVPAPSNPSGSENISKPVNNIPAAGTVSSNPVSVIDKKVVMSAINRNAPIYATYTDASLRADALTALAKKKDRDLKVVTKRYTAIINSESITEAKDISLAIKMTKNSKMGAMILRTEQKGAFGCKVDIVISAKYYVQCGIDLNDAHIYYIDENKQVNDMGSITIDKNSNITIPMTEGGKYIIM